MDGTLTKKDKLYTLRLERSLAHAPEKVWRVLTEREFLRQWFPCDIEGEWQVGEPLKFMFLHGEGDNLPEEDLRGEVLAVEPERLLEFRWGDHLIRFDLSAAGEGCRFALSESFDDASIGARDAAGWEMCLDNLDLILEGAAAAKFAVDVWRKKFEHYRQKFEPEAGPQQGMPDDHPGASE